jgi:hypothetical protein
LAEEENWPAAVGRAQELLLLLLGAALQVGVAVDCRSQSAVFFITNQSSVG